MLRQGTHLYQKLFLSKSPCAAKPVILHQIRIFAIQKRLSKLESFLKAFSFVFVVNNKLPAMPLDQGLPCISNIIIPNVSFGTHN